MLPVLRAADWPPARYIPGLVVGVLVLLVAGCSGSGATQSIPTSTTANTHSTTSPKQDTGPSGDIPDSATYLTFHGPVYSLLYVEGWVQEAAPNDGIRFSDKDSFVSVALQSIPSGSMADYARGAGATASASEFQQFTNPHASAVSLLAGEAGLLTFQALSVPDPVTGKTVVQTYDRYYIHGPLYMAVLTEATPLGVDNVDAFLQIARSFAWVSH